MQMMPFVAFQCLVEDVLALHMTDCRKAAHVVAANALVRSSFLPHAASFHPSYYWDRVLQHQEVDDSVSFAMPMVGPHVAAAEREAVAAAE